MLPEVKLGEGAGRRPPGPWAPAQTEVFQTAGGGRGGHLPMPWLGSSPVILGWVEEIKLTSGTWILLGQIIRSLWDGYSSSLPLPWFGPLVRAVQDTQTGRRKTATHFTPLVSSCMDHAPPGFEDHF